MEQNAKVKMNLLFIYIFSIHFNDASKSYSNELTKKETDNWINHYKSGMDLVQRTIKDNKAEIMKEKERLKEKYPSKDIRNQSKDKIKIMQASVKISKETNVLMRDERDKLEKAKKNHK